MAGRRIAHLAAGAAAAAAVLLAWATGVLGGLERASVDARFSLRGAQPAPEVAVVDLDDASIRALGTWPVSRRRHASMVDRLRRAGVRAIAYDVQFTEESDDLRADLALFEAVARARGTVLATTSVGEGGSHEVLGGEANLREAGARAGSALLPNDPGGVIRRMPGDHEGLASFSAAVAETVLGARLDRAAAAGGRRAWIDYAGPPRTVLTLPFSRVLEDPRAAARLRGRVVVVGSSAASLQDLHAVSTSRSELMPGPEIQANAIATALRGYPLRSVPPWADALAAALAALLVAGLFALLRLRWALAGAVALAAAWAAAALAAFEAGRVVSVSAPLAGVALATLGCLAVRFVGEARERRRVRAVFGRFVPEAVVDEVLAAAGGDLRLGGVRREATVMFCDLRGFTAFAEREPAERVIEVLNRYLSEMSEAILDHGGTLVSYMGDGIMAVFGSPLERDDHADAAVGATREMLEVRLGRFNAGLAAEGVSPFRIGIGLNSGPVMSGNVGSERRLEYAAIGDTTNVAARLESSTKGTAQQVHIADSTRAALRRPAALAEVGDVAIAGRRGGVRVWTLAPTQSVHAGDGSSPQGGARRSPV